MNYLLVSLGGGLGAISRYALSVWINNYWNHDFPLNTWIINCVGSFLFRHLP
ncbi:fluoride efflux transporter FluC [Bacillus coahuilensis]|uniref:fluoride efflux transporter FluC n=1 Tax=Bacillus coahuilensis TaxID=408580 RepID=UPI0001850D43|nr:CrcB family protein [Bacillus coahuilensis]